MTTPESLSRRALDTLDALVRRCPELAACHGSLEATATLVVRCFSAGGRLYLCGNGGSHADCLHIAGELVKSYSAARPLSVSRRQALTVARLPDGALLAGSLQAGLPAVALGTNGAVSSAIGNDLGPEFGLAQELEALGCTGDVMLVLSTSGASRNVVLATQVACSLGMGIVAFTGAAGASSPVGRLAHVVVAAPGSSTNEVQEQHSRMYHALCGAIEAELF